MSIDRQKVLAQLFERLYGSPVIRNDLRGELVEEIVGLALAPDWKLSGSDWGACDLQHASSGYKIQVKQSAAKQSWDAGKNGRSLPRFSIAAKTGRYEGPDWIAGEGRNADIFVFAWHNEMDSDCDHANPVQWKFYVVAESVLPAQKSLGLSQVESLTAAVEFADLSAAVDAVVAEIQKLVTSANL